MNKGLFHIKLIDSYIIQKYLVSFFYSMILITIILVIIDLSENIDDFLKPDVSWQRVVFEYYAGYVPFYINYSYPLINFIATIYFTSRMANNNEIISIYSNGISHWRLIRPYFITSLFLMVILLLFNLYLLPYTNSLKYKFDTEVINPNTRLEKSDIHIRLSDDTYTYVGSYNPKNKIARNIVMYKIDDLELKQKNKIGSLSWDSLKKSWTMRNIDRRTFNGLKESTEFIAERDTIFDLLPEDLEGTIYLYASMTMKVLGEKIEKEKTRGTGSLTYLLLEKYRRFIYPISTIILMVIGFSVASRKKRGGTGLSLGLGVILSFIYILFVQFSDVFATKGGYSPLISILIPNLIFAFVGIILFFRVQR